MYNPFKVVTFEEFISKKGYSSFSMVTPERAAPIVAEYEQYLNRNDRSAWIPLGIVATVALAVTAAKCLMED